jgi:2-dehydro-3-deoxygluconokinase
VRYGLQAADGPLVVGLGEALVRLTARDRVPLEYATGLTVDIGGAELNVLIALAQLGCRTRWVSRLPQNPLGRQILGHARRHGVDADIDWDADARSGLYFVEEGVYPRSTQVLYDRVGSAASLIRPGMFDWTRILDSAAALHCTGITCALRPEAEQAVTEAFKLAAGAGVATTFDLNYRSQLWTRPTAAAALSRVLPHVDILFASPFDLELIAGTENSSGQPEPGQLEVGQPEDGQQEAGRPEAEAGRDLAQDVRQTFGISQVIVRTQREVSAGALEVRVEAFGDHRVVAGTARASVLDAFGAGDAAVAAFLARWLAKAPLEEAVGAAARACAYMYTIPGDTWLRPPDDFDSENARLGRIRR